MKILLDHNIDRRLRQHLVGHDVKTARQMGWEALANGMLLRSAADAGFDALISVDKKLEHERNLRTLPLPVVVLDALSNALPSLLPLVPGLLRLCSGPMEKALYVIDSDGNSRKVSTPGS